MDCKKGPEYSKKCQCLKRKYGGCEECEKKAIKVVYESGRDLNETIEFVKESGEEIDDLYVAVDGGFDNELECMPSFAFRSAIDILRGVCEYCERLYSKACVGCMWSNGLDGEDRWLFDDHGLRED
jgi:hypothetical protein